MLVGHLGQAVDTVALLLDLPQFGVAHDHRIDHRVLLEGELVLAQLADALVGGDGHIAGAGCQAAVEDLHEGGLAAAVGADQAIAVAVTELDGDILEQWLGAKLHGDVCCGDQEGVPEGGMAGARSARVKAAHYTDWRGRSRGWVIGTSTVETSTGVWSDQYVNQKGCCNRGISLRRCHPSDPEYGSVLRNIDLHIQVLL